MNARRSQRELQLTSYKCYHPTCQPKEVDFDRFKNSLILRECSCKQNRLLFSCWKANHKCGEVSDTSIRKDCSCNCNECYEKQKNLLIISAKVCCIVVSIPISMNNNFLILFLRVHHLQLMLRRKKGVNYIPKNRLLKKKN